MIVIGFYGLLKKKGVIFGPLVLPDRIAEIMNTYSCLSIVIAYPLDE